jgi:hypothetical protein
MDSVWSSGWAWRIALYFLVVYLLPMLGKYGWIWT